MPDKKTQAAHYYDYLICVECESPCYVFEFRSEQLVEAFCEACSNDDPDLFLPEEDFEGLAAESAS